MSKKEIKKAIFPVGGLGTRFLPATKTIPKEMLPILDKPLVQYAVEEALEAGIEEFIFVTGRGKSSIEDYFDHSIELENRLKDQEKNQTLDYIQNMILKPGTVSFVRQQNPFGLGHAVWCARNFISEEPVAILLADDLIDSKPGCMKQMIQNWDGGNMVATMEVKKNQTSSYGIISHGKIFGDKIEVKSIIEKPKPEEAPSTTAVVGRYIIQPGVFKHLGLQKKGANDEIQLTDSLSNEIGKSPFFAFNFSGTRYDCGTKLGYIKANTKYALKNSLIREEYKNWLNNIIKDD
tara:strand:+ start:949 stop:1824 length:876 start_codon:yes stop_codon:yes gene_type:complete